MKRPTFIHKVLIISTLITCLLLKVQAQFSKIEVQTGHAGKIYSLAYSPDGKYLVSASSDGTMKVWELATGKIVRSLEGHSGAVYTVEFSPDGHFLASGGFDKTIKIWDFKTGKIIKTFRGHHNSVFKLLFSHDGKRLASAGWDYVVKLWDLEQSKELLTFKEHRSFVLSLDFSPNDSQIVSCGGDEQIFIWEANTGKVVRNLQGHDRAVTDVKFNHKMDFLLSCGQDQSIRFWNLETGLLIKVIREKNFLTSLCFSPDSQSIVVASGKPAVIIKPFRQREMELDKKQDTVLPPGNLIKKLKVYQILDTVQVNDSLQIIEKVISGRRLRTFTGHSDKINKVVYSPDGKHIASASNDKTIKIWDAETGKLVKNLVGQVSGIKSAVVSRDGKFMLTFSGNFFAQSPYTIKLWDIYNAEQLQTFKPSKQRLTCIDISSDGQIIATGDALRRVKLWKVGKYKSFRTFRGHSQKVNRVKFFPSGKYVSSVSNDGSVCIWETDSRKLLFKLQEHRGRVLALDICPSKALFATGGIDKKIIIWKYNTYLWLRVKVKQVIAAHQGAVQALAFSPNGSLLASGSGDRTIKIHKTSDGELIQSLEGDNQWVSSLSFSNDGKYLAANIAHKKIKIWEIQSGELLTTLKAHKQFVEAVKFVPHSHLLLSASHDASVKLWDWKKSEELCSFYSMKDENYLSIAPDNFYKRSLDKGNSLAFVNGINILNFNKLDSIYKQADTLTKRLHRYLIVPKPVKRDSLKTDSTQVEQEEDYVEHEIWVNVLNRDSITDFVSERILKLEVQAIDNQYVMSNLYVSLNGKDLYGKNGKKLKKEKTKNYITTLKIPLILGENRIELRAKNIKGQSSPKEIIIVEYEKEE